MPRGPGIRPRDLSLAPIPRPAGAAAILPRQCSTTNCGGMTMEDWTWLVIVLVAIALASVIGLILVKRRDLHRTRLQTDPAYRYESDRKQLEKALRRAQHDHKIAVSKAGRVLTAAQKDPVKATVSRVKLTPLSVIVGRATYPLSERSTFQLEVDGQVQAVAGHRIGATRMATGALLGGVRGMAVGALAQKSTVKMEDTREVYLTVRDEAWGEVVRLGPADIESAKKFVLAAEIAVNTLQRSAEEKHSRVLAARDSLTAIEADTSAIRQAEANLATHEERRPRDGII